MNNNIIKDIYENMLMGVLGIDEVLYKVKDKSLLTTLKKLKKDYQRILDYSKEYLENTNQEIPKLSMMTQISTELVSSMKLNKENSDEIIIKMMQKGINNSLNILSSKKIDYNSLDIISLKIVSNTFSLLIRSNKKMSKYSL